MISKSLPRRTFLRGLGTAIALPWLEAMMPASAWAASTGGKKPPLRLAFFYVPNGVHVPDWKPSGEGALTRLPWILEPLESVKDRVLVLTGLTCDKARPNGDGPGDHARAASAFLTCAQPRKTAGADIRVGISVDQLAAKFIGKETRFPSLELGTERGRQAGNCDSGYSCAYSSNISWQSESTPVAKEIDPRQLFERLFGNGDPQEMAESRDRRLLYRRSILDFVLDDARALRSQLGHKDQQKLDEYLTGVREIERRLALLERQGEMSAPDGVQAPAGIPAEYGEHVRLMFDMLALAFQSDLTRVATFMYANEGSNRPYRQIGIAEGHHDLSHHEGNPEKQAKIRAINRFHMEQFAYFLQKLASIQEGNGTLLDNTMIVYGSAIGDGNRHNHDDLPILVAGGGGGTLKTGRAVQYARETPVANLWVSLLQRLELPIHQFGDSNGKLDGLF